ncbi:MAG: PIG-L family deacetylase [Flavihumibacter sp.]
MTKTLLFFLVAVGLTARAQSPLTESSADILLGLQKLKVLGSVLYIAAHPDDENTRLLAYMAKERKLKTGYLSLTRGDGGQNLIGDEQGVSLGLIRTQELLAARRIDGAQQFFSRAYDFGFSKSTDEALRIWNKEKILSDVVWVIRRFRPDVVITRFPPDERAGHGHHSASAVLAIEAFKAAADPKRFPEQLQWTEPWQAKRILWNTFNFGTVNTQNDNQYKIDVGVFNPLLGKGYGEIAAESRSQHKSQGFGVPRQRGEAYEYFQPIAGDSMVNDLFDNVNTTWERIGKKEVGLQIDSIIDHFKPLQPSAIVPELVKLRLKLTPVPGAKIIPWLNEKVEELDRLIRSCLGFYAEAVANQQMAVTGDSIQVTLNMVNRSAIPVKNVTLHYIDTLIRFLPAMTDNKMYSISFKKEVPFDFMSDQPYWLREQMDTGSFKVDNQLLIGRPENIKTGVALNYQVGGLVMQDILPLRYKYTDPVKGEIYQPVIVVPPVVAGAAPSIILNNLVPAGKHDIDVSYKSYSDRDSAQGGIEFLSIDARAQQRTSYLAYNLAFRKYQLERFHINFDSVFAKQKPETLYPFVAVKEAGKTLKYNNAMKLIQYDHIPTVHYFFPTSVKVINEEIKTVGSLIGFINGSGDAMPEALKAMGFTVELLDDAALSSADLSRYDAIITGVRAYNIKESLNGHYDRLMQYVWQGGNLIVQYNTSSQIGPLRAKIGPYPFNISRTRVTDEKAAVTVLDEKSPIMLYPNKIGAKDFTGWIQERSIYHASGWDANYKTLFSMNDPGEQPDAGSLIYTQYGKGYFTYTGLVFYRELPAGVSGAYRLLANLIALNHKKGL